MQNKKGSLTGWLAAASLPVLSAYAVVAAFSTYFCMYAFRKPFAAAQFTDQHFWNTQIDLKTALVISQIIGYALSKYIGIKVCSEITRQRRAVLLVAMIVCAQAALVLYGALPDRWKFLAIFLNGMPLGMVWGLVVWYLEGRRTSEILLAGLSCSFIVASGIVRNVGQQMMGVYGVSEGWMPAATGGLFLLPFLICVALLYQIPPPNEEDAAARTLREPMDRASRLAFVRQFFWGIMMLVVAYFFLTAYRDYRDNYQVELFEELGYRYEDVTQVDENGGQIVTPGNKIIIIQAETIVAFGVLIVLGLLFLIKNNRIGLLATFGIMTVGVLLMGAGTFAWEAGWIDGFVWMTCVGLGSYLAYVPYGSVLFDRLVASTRVVGTAVFAIYVADAIGYTGSVGVLIYRDVLYREAAQSNSSRLAFFVDFTYLMSGLGALLLLGSCAYFLLCHVKKVEK